MLSISSGGRSTLSFAGLLRFLLLLPVNADLLPESNNGAENDVVDNKTTKLPILSIDEHSEDVEEKKSSMGDFFMNMFPILSFATLGTVISALTIGSALYVLGQANLMYKMSVAESFAFGLMISAVDPVATLAIFQALNVQRMLKLFGESILNDVVSIVLTSTSLEMSLQNVTCSTSVSLFFPVISRFTYIFLISALLETCIFAYLGLALFTIKLQFEPMFVSWSILLCFVGRAFNVFPLAYLANKCRRPQISIKNQFIMWYSGMRGAVAFALALHISIENQETKRVLLTTTLFIVLFTIIFLGGTTLPVLRMLSDTDRFAVLLFKFIFDQSEHLADTEEIDKFSKYERDTYKGVAYKFNELFVRPLFELQENRMSLHRITSKLLNADCSVNDSSLPMERPLVLLQ
uniref:Cation/H+ exchanger transmembrane domain-containing protein n=1 Tax=Wuchereria bancrofti TaxID=6293 RepID=A0AAF5Q1A5_WUCBA